MFSLRWTVVSPWSASALAERIRREPRWNGWRDGFPDGRFLIAERYPVEVDTEGFCFVVPSSPKMFVVCRARFEPVASGTQIELRATPQREVLFVLGVMTLLMMSVVVIGLWSVSLWLALGIPLVVFTLVLLIWTFQFWWNARQVRQRVSRFLTQVTPSETE